jgi:coenzyme PQQ biosynthesis protein PqqD
MSTDRGRQQPRSRGVIQLAPGVRLTPKNEKSDVFVLISADGKVHLNNGALAILRLCDGSRDRDGIVAELMRRSRRRALAAEILEFLDAARARGWIIEE